jgi:hypothetical protein
VRKSLLSALYGIAIAEGRISLSSTLAQLGTERQAAETDAWPKSRRPCANC